MSFILDALKKSEAQRQRADAPALYEMKMAPPRHHVPAWLLVLGGLLIINLGVLSVVLLRGNHSASPQADANGTTAAAVAPAAAATAPAATAPAATAPAVVAPAAAATPPAASTLANASGAAPNGASGTGSADDAPAVEPAPAPAAASSRSSADVPTYDQAASAPGANLPELKLDLHAYASNPADRFVYLNMVKLKEGESSPAGVRVESITPDGAILSWHGAKFFLQRQ